MTLDVLLASRERTLADFIGTAPEEPCDERTLLLELATSLEKWPARNVVFREALDRAAQDLVRMASEHDPARFGREAR